MHSHSNLTPFYSPPCCSFYTALPFPSLIDWQNITLRLVPSYTSSQCIDADVRWLTAQHARSLDSARRRGHRAYTKHLDYTNPAGVASALLAEIAFSRGIGKPKQAALPSTRSSRSAISWL